MVNILVIKDDNRQNSIPKGRYCYDENGVCPFWSLKSKYNGYCSYLNIDDDSIDGIGLLWDQCKECDINDEEEYV